MKREDACVLAEQPICPMCGSAARQDCEIPYRSNRYVEAGATSLGLEERALFDQMKGWQCSSCGTVYFDPWLSPRFARDLYHRILPHHNLGWYEFYDVVRNPDAVLRRTSLVERLRAALPSLKTYAEVGCPFEGLLPYFAVRPYRAGDEQFLDYPGCVAVDEGDVRRNPDVRGNRINFERIGRACSSALNRLQLLRVFPPARLRQQYLHWSGRARAAGTQDVSTMYLEKESSVHWGSHCQSFNVQCRRMAEDVLACGAARLSDLASHESFDLIGIFNALDHYMKPIQLLHELLAISKFVYVEGHGKTDAGKQHPFLLSAEVFSKLPLPGASVVGHFSGVDDSETFSVLIRRDA
jgi:hypothetical protein